MGRTDRCDIEFYNGLIKGIVSCHDLVQKSGTMDEAREKLDTLLAKVRRKISGMVEEALS